MFRPHADFIEGQEPYGPLQHLVEAEAGPQSQVGAEEVEGGHEVEGVHGDPGDWDVVREGDPDNVGVLTPRSVTDPATMVEVVLLQGTLQPDAATVPPMRLPKRIQKTENIWESLKSFLVSSSYQFVPKTFLVCS